MEGFSIHPESYAADRGDHVLKATRSKSLFQRFFGAIFGYRTRFNLNKSFFSTSSLTLVTLKQRLNVLFFLDFPGFLSVF